MRDQPTGQLTEVRGEPSSNCMRPRGALGWRAFVLGVFLIPLNSYWVVQMEKVRAGPFPTTISLFANAIFVLVFLSFLQVSDGVGKRWGVGHAWRSVCAGTELRSLYRTHRYHDL